jgi:hypothetical protein
MIDGSRWEHGRLAQYVACERARVVHLHARGSEEHEGTELRQRTRGTHQQVSSGGVYRLHVLKGLDTLRTHS